MSPSASGSACASLRVDRSCQIKGAGAGRLGPGPSVFSFPQQAAACRTPGRTIDRKRVRRIMERRLIVVDGSVGVRYEALSGSPSDEDRIGNADLAAACIFRHLVEREMLSTVVASALRDGRFTELDAIRNLPGMVRAALQSLEERGPALPELEKGVFSYPSLSGLRAFPFEDLAVGHGALRIVFA